MKTHKLMIKTHNVTGLKYLCYTRSEGETYANYKGSGKKWKRHLKKYGDDITTKLLFETEDMEQFKKIAIAKSIEYDIVKSEDWANLKLEEGDGGDTVSNKMWITDGTIDKYILKEEVIPAGWKKGRSNCVFNDPNKQKEFNSRLTTETRRKGMKKAWDTGKMDHRDNTNLGSANSKPEVREKISKALTGMKRSEETRRKLSEAGKKKVFTEEHRRNISEAAKKRYSLLKNECS